RPRPTACPSPRLRGEAGRGAPSGAIGAPPAPTPPLPPQRGGGARLGAVGAGPGAGGGEPGGGGRGGRKGGGKGAAAPAERPSPPMAGGVGEGATLRSHRRTACPHPNPPPQAGEGAVPGGGGSRTRRRWGRTWRRWERDPVAGIKGRDAPVRRPAPPPACGGR